MSTQLIDTVSDVLALCGAALEKNGERLEALLPEEVSRKLSLPELAVLCFDAENSHRDGELITYQSDIVDRLFELMQDTGNHVSLTLKDLYLKQGVEAAAAKHFKVLNGLGRALASHEQYLPYALINFKYTAVSDEKKEGLVSTVINECTLARVSGAAWELHLTQAEARAQTVDLPCQPFDDVYRAACHSVQPIIQKELSDFRKSLNRRLHRDIRRLTEYYADLVKEIRRKIERRGLEGKEREHEESRIRATELELQHKIADQRGKYALKVHAEPVNMLRFFLPVKVADFEVRFSKSTRAIPLVWNPLLKDFEPVTCESCHSGLDSFWLCEHKLHHVCTSCFKCRGCGNKICHACFRKKCPKCGAGHATPTLHFGDPTL